MDQEFHSLGKVYLFALTLGARKLVILNQKNSLTLITLPLDGYFFYINSCPLSQSPSRNKVKAKRKAFGDNPPHLSSLDLDTIDAGGLIFPGFFLYNPQNILGNG